MKWLIQAFEFRHYAFDENNKFDNNTIHRLESSFHSCGVSYVMKLNDKSFRPLFANLVRWAISGEGSNATGNTELSRLLAFFRFFNKLQDKLKSIISLIFLLDRSSLIDLGQICQWRYCWYQLEKNLIEFINLIFQIWPRWLLVTTTEIWKYLQTIVEPIIEYRA